MGWPAGNGINPYNSKFVTVENALVTGPMADAALRITANESSVYSPGMGVYGSIAVGAGMNTDGSRHAYPLVSDPQCYVPTDGPPYYTSPWGLGVWGQGDVPGPVFRDVLAYGNAGWGFASVKPFGAGVTGGVLDHAATSFEPGFTHVRGAPFEARASGTALRRMHGIEPWQIQRVDVWQLPGGGVEFGEKLEDALLRECREEIGVEVMIDATLPHIESQVQGSWQGVFICYVCHMANPDSDIILNEEASEFGWYTYAEIRNLNLMPLLDRIFAAVIENNI
jgi:ADP-ribose pyrophosphatase YjhB (NUDIX family)